MRKFGGRTGYILLAIALLFVVVAGVAGRHAIASQLNDWKLLPRPERLTELYFTDHTKLPSTFTPGSALPVAFTVHNVEYRSTTYHYVITAANNDGSQHEQLIDGHFTLDQNEVQRVTQTITVPATPDLGNRVKVSVDLSYQGIKFGQDTPSHESETINYWVTNGITNHE